MENFITEIQKSKKWEEFEKWYQIDPYKEVRGISPSAYIFITQYPFLFQQGIFLEFLRECGTDINHRAYYPKGEPKYYVFNVHPKNPDDFEQPEPNDNYSMGLQEAILTAFNLFLK